MCPRSPAPPRSFTRPPLPGVNDVFVWAATAQCVISYVYRHRIDRSNIICAHCFLGVTLEEQANYAYKTRHYIHVGIVPRYEVCILCRTVLGNPRPARECGTCSAVLPDFLRYINQAGDAPHMDPEATIVAISESLVARNVA